MDIDFELEKIYKVLEEKKYKRVLIQLPDGLKQYSNIIYDEIRKRFPDIELFIYLGSNFGGCDIPIWLDKYGFDLIIHFGHTEFYKQSYE